MLLTDSLTEFFLAKDHTPATRRFYQQNLTRFFAGATAQQVTEAHSITAPLVRGYLDERKTQPSETTGRLLSSHSLHATARALFA
jgi:site-specific recombinase XerD